MRGGGGGGGGGAEVGVMRRGKGGVGVDHLTS